MHKIKALGKQELKDIGCNFVVLNSPAFATSLSSNLKLMKVEYFKDLESVKLFISKNIPTIVFDQTGIYKEKADIQSKVVDLNKNYFIRCCTLTPTEFENFKKMANVEEEMILTTKIDMSCWFNNN